jgi:hypothetical protein
MRNETRHINLKSEFNEKYICPAPLLLMAHRREQKLGEASLKINMLI